MGIIAFFKKLIGIEGADGNGKGQAGNMELSCVDCRKSFAFEAGEQEFFKQRGLTPPKRCPACRGRKRRRR